MADLFDSLPAAYVLCTFVQYLIAFYSRPEAASNVISGEILRQIVSDKTVKFGDSMSNDSRYIRGAAFVSNERTNISEVETPCKHFA